MTPFLQLTDVRAQLGRFSLSFTGTFSQGWTGVYGPSGAGKTTLLEIVAGLRRPLHGRVVMEGRTLSDAERSLFVPPHRRGIGYVPQDVALFPHLTVRENLAYSRPADPVYLDHVAGRLEISGLLDRNARLLSGGEARRVALARALVARPRLLLLDEPMAGLDDALKLRIVPFLLRVRDEFQTPMLYVSHSADEIMGLCTTVALVREGQLQAHGATNQFFVARETPSFTPREG